MLALVFLLRHEPSCNVPDPFHLLCPQADGDSDTGSLGALLNDVSKVVHLNTGFRFVFVFLSISCV